jgi:hypothetical protein
MSHSRASARHAKLVQLRVLLHGAAAITYDGSTKIQRYYGRYPADNGGCALQCVIRNVKDEKLFVGLGNVNVICVGEHHGTNPLGFSPAP